MIEVKNISKSYAGISAIKDITFTVEKGKLFGFIGPDGAGKTTLIRILTTLLLPDKGEARVGDLDVVDDFKKLRKSIGYMPGRFSLYEDLSVKENLSLFAAIFGTTIEKNYHLIEDIYKQIEPFRNRRAGALSGGMKQKLALSCAMIHAPEVIFLDEPTTGVDPVSRKEFWQMLRKLKDAGITILVSTPYMDEAALCDEVALIQDGDVLQIDSPQDIIESYGNMLFSIPGHVGFELIDRLRKADGVQNAYLFGEEIRMVFKETIEQDSVQHIVQSVGVPGELIRPVTPTVEDCFIQLMQKQE